MIRAIVSWVVCVGWLVALVLNLTTAERHGGRFWTYTVLDVGGVLAFGWQGARQWLAARSDADSN